MRLDRDYSRHRTKRQCRSPLRARNRVEREKSFPALFRGLEIGHYRPDLIVNNEVVVEIKNVERYDPVFLAQLLSYLRVTRLTVGLVINFSRPRMVDGIKRVSL